MSAFELVHVNQSLIITPPFVDVIVVGDLHFNVEGTVGAFLFDVNVKADDFTVSTSLDSFFAFGIADLLDFGIENEFEQTTAQVRKKFHSFAEDKVILNGSIVPLLSD